MVDEKINKIAEHPLQTSYWGEFRKNWGNEILYTKFGLLTLHKLPFTNFKVAIFEKGPTPTKEMLDELKIIARKNNIFFIKLEPFISRKKLGLQKTNNVIRLLKTNGCTKGKTLFTPTTFWIDLTKSEDELMNSFHSKTRYNIRYAERKGVEVKEDNSESAFQTYLKLTFETAKRQGFYAHTKKYHKLMWEYLHTRMVKEGQRPIARLLVAKYKGKILTTWIVFFWRDFLYYPYGASSDEMRNVMASNLMMWEVICYGKSLGAKTFDLWGKEEGKGFTKFKEGYNPEVVEFLGSWDLIINKPTYWLYRLAEKIRWFFLRKLPLRI